MDSPAEGPVRTRRVHYLSGFDPRGPGFYHRLYREEAQRQAPLLGTVLRVGRRARLAPHVSGWRVEAEWARERVQTDYRFMGWDDLIRQHWEPSTFRLLRRASLGAYLTHLAGGGLARIRRVCRGAFYSVFFPPAYLFALLVSMLAAGLGLRGLCADWLGTLPGALAGVAVAAVIGAGGLRLGDRLGLFWLLRICLFVHAWGSRPIPGMEARLLAVAEHILEEQRRQPVDEVLIVGHSVGAILAVSVLARMLRRADEGGLPPGIALLTLGQCIPLLSFMPSAQAFREDLHTVAQGTAVPWVDVTAPPDPLCFFRVDPLEVSGVKAPVPERPRCVSARFFPMFHPATYKKLRRNKLRLHFQYLMAAERPGNYDFFQLTAGPRPLTAFP